MDWLLICTLAICPVQAPAESVSISISISPQADAWVAEDKLKHFAMSYLITVGSAAAVRLTAEKNVSLTIGVSVSAAAGILKELRDQRRSFKDLAWDAAGIAAGIVVVQQTR